MGLVKSVFMLPADYALLAMQKRLAPPYGRLTLAASFDLASLLSPREEWPGIQQELAAVAKREENATGRPSEGALNSGDRRAIYHLVRSIKPANILEVGTHIGSSTTHIAAALRENAKKGSPGRLTTVDIIDVNGPDAPWKRGGMERSPRQMVEALGMGEAVQFRTSDSLPYLQSCEDTYDLVFLDGSHRAKDVYNEVQMVQRCLRPGATILLHDFFPGGRPLWSGARPIPGPWLAYARLQKEKAPVRAIPLGELPWPTKRDSSVTSLALMGAA